MGPQECVTSYKGSWPLPAFDSEGRSQEELHLHPLALPSDRLPIPCCLSGTGARGQVPRETLEETGLLTVMDSNRDSGEATEDAGPPSLPLQCASFAKELSYSRLTT